MGARGRGEAGSRLSSLHSPQLTNVGKVFCCPEYAEARELKEGGTVACSVSNQALRPTGEWKAHLTWETGAGKGLPAIATLESKSKRLEKIADYSQGIFCEQG